MTMLYADIVMPLAQPAYCYSVPDALRDEVRRGDAVAVQFGRRNVYTGIVWRLHSDPPAVARIKPVMHGCTTVRC